MQVDFVVRLRPDATPRELGQVQALLTNNSVSASVPADTGRQRLLLIEVQCNFGQCSEELNDWESAMQFTEATFQSLRLTCTGLDAVMATAGLSWWPIVFVDNPDCGSLDSGLGDRGVDHFARWRITWDGAVVHAEDPAHRQQLSRIAVRATAQWAAATSSILAARKVLQLSAEGTGVGEVPAALLQRARSDLVESLVELDPRVGLFYAYEFDFADAVSREWRSDTQLELARRCLEAVSGVIGERAQGDMLRTQESQREHARSTSFWLFVVSVASGVSVVFGAVEFLSERTTPAVGNSLRFAILATCIASTAVLSWRYRHREGSGR